MKPSHYSTFALFNGVISRTLYYIPEHIPTAKYIPWFRNLKINRQWAKFARRYQRATGRTINYE